MSINHSDDSVSGHSTGSDSPAQNIKGASMQTTISASGQHPGKGTSMSEDIQSFLQPQTSVGGGVGNTSSSVADAVSKNLLQNAGRGGKVAASGLKQSISSDGGQRTVHVEGEDSGIGRKRSVKVRSILEGALFTLSAELEDKKFKSLPPARKLQELAKILSKLNITDEKQIEAIIAMVRKGMEAAKEQREYAMNEISGVSSIEVETMTRLSKMKFAVARIRMRLETYFDALPEIEKQALLEKGIDKRAYVRREMKEIRKNFFGLPQDIVSKLYNRYGFNRDAYLFYEAFGNDFGSMQENLEDVALQFDYNVTDILAAVELSPHLGVNTDRIKTEIGIQDSSVESKITGNYLAGSNQLNSGIAIEGIESYEVSQGNFINPNWFLYDLDAETLQKIWGIPKTKQVFGGYFFKRLQAIPGVGEIDLPTFYNFCDFKLRQTQQKATEGEIKLENCTQHVFEWELPELFTYKELHALAQGLKSVLPDLAFSGKETDFEHPIKTVRGRMKYAGYFAGESSFFNSSILLLSQIGNKDQKKRVLRFSTGDTHDTVLFVLLQISSFLKSGNLFREKHLWITLYRMYNTLSLENVSSFDPRVFKEQYDTIVKKVIWPLSTEYASVHGSVGKPSNALLYGLYGTGKSQLLGHVLHERKYTLPNGKDIHLNANVISISVIEFADILTKSVSSFKKRLSDIHENTGLPIILVIEDLDTIIKETAYESDPISQGLTTFFDGVGSLPVTVLTSTNNPEIFPTRHIRPNRLDVLLGFDYPISEQSIRKVLGVHFTASKLAEKTTSKLTLEQFEKYIVPKILQFTPSHIAKLCQDISNELEFVDVRECTTEDIFAIVDDCFDQMLIPVKDMQARQVWMKKWHDSLRLESTGGMGFIG